MEFLRENGIMLGTRYRNGRRVFLYPLKDFFVEVTYHKDDMDLDPEKMETFSSVTHLNSHLEREFTAALSEGRGVTPPTL